MSGIPDNYAAPLALPVLEVQKPQESETPKDDFYD